MQNTIRDLRQTIANLEETIAELNRRFFGISSEHSKNISLPADKESDIAEDISEDDAKEPPAKTKKSSKPRKPKASREELYASLPICEVKCPLPDDQKFCPDCGTPLEPMGYTFVREELRVIPAKLFRYAALRDMNEIIRTDLLKKEYYTITVGIPQSGRFTAWWEHDEKNNKVSIHAHQAQDEHRKQIITDVDVLRTAGPFALCKIGLVTGRTHQIRAHLAYLGKPVLGDIKYGNRKMNERTGTKTQALCAVRITFREIPEKKHPAIRN